METQTQTTTKPEITEDYIRGKVTTNPFWAERAILALYARQTTDERAIGETVEKNHMGFTGVDAEILTSFAQQIENNPRSYPEGQRLSPRQLAIAYKKLGKYAKQLLLVAKEKAASEAQ